jgi:hypothetical protein
VFLRPVLYAKPSRFLVRIPWFTDHGREDDTAADLASALSPSTMNFADPL